MNASNTMQDTGITTSQLADDLIQEGVKAAKPATTDLKVVNTEEKSSEKVMDASKEYEIHPLCELVQPMSPEEFEVLKDSIAQNGILNPIVFHGDTIVDGRSRYQALKDKKKMIWTTLADHLGIEEDAIDDEVIRQFVISQNIERRHLTPSQRAMVVEKLVAWKRGDVGLTIKAASEKASVSASTIKHAHKVAEHGTPTLNKAVEGGEIKVSDAAKVADASPIDQAKAVNNVRKAAKEGKKATVAKAAPKREGNPTDSKVDLSRKCDKHTLAELKKMVVSAADDVDASKGYYRVYNDQIEGGAVSAIVIVFENAENGMAVNDMDKFKRLVLPEKA